jgi:hypothetical protein
MSDWRESANKRRNARQARLPIRPPSVSRRDTKKWCRGKVGVEHKSYCVSYNDLKNTRATYADEWKVLICTACGKQLAHWWPSVFRPTKEQAPDWVTR